MKTVLLILLALLLISFLIYALLIRGRNGHKNWERLHGWVYAHRGLHNKPMIPENSLSAFRLAVEKGYGAEFDVHLLKDGTLAVFHDSTLNRCTGADGILEELTAADLCKYNLEGSSESIPTFQQVLEIFDGKTPLIIELKTYKNNGAQLSEAVCKELEHYKGAYCLESFDPRCLLWLKKNRPDIIRGQLSMNFMKSPSGQGRIIDFILTYLLENVATRPDFVAYHFHDRKNISNQICLNLWGIQGASWTIRSQEEFESCMMENLLPIFEQFEPELFPEE